MAEQPNVPGDLRHIVIAAIEEATRRRAHTVEAEDLLLAVAASPTAEADALAAAGLGHTALLGMLEAERARSLAALGVSEPGRERLRATPRVTRPTWGTSLRTALLRSRRRGGRRLTGADAAMGVLLAEYGTVPRALAYAEIDREAVIRSLRELSS